MVGSFLPNLVGGASKVVHIGWGEEAQDYVS